MKHFFCFLYSIFIDIKSAVIISCFSIAFISGIVWITLLESHSPGMEMARTLFSIICMVTSSILMTLLLLYAIPFLYSYFSKIWSETAQRRSDSDFSREWQRSSTSQSDGRLDRVVPQTQQIKEIDQFLTGIQLKQVQQDPMDIPKSHIDPVPNPKPVSRYDIAKKS